MVDDTKLCKKIQEIYPDMGDCDKNLSVDWDAEQDVWSVDFNKGPHRIRHYLEDADAAACLDDGHCLELGIEFGQFR